jgi:hypothetical protein
MDGRAVIGPDTLAFDFFAFSFGPLFSLSSFFNSSNGWIDIYYLGYQSKAHGDLIFGPHSGFCLYFFLFSLLFVLYVFSNFQFSCE